MYIPVGEGEGRERRGGGKGEEQVAVYINHLGRWGVVVVEIICTVLLGRCYFPPRFANASTCAVLTAGTTGRLGPAGSLRRRLHGIELHHLRVGKAPAVLLSDHHLQRCDNVCQDVICRWGIL